MVRLAAPRLPVAQREVTWLEPARVNTQGATARAPGGEPIVYRCPLGTHTPRASRLPFKSTATDVRLLAPDTQRIFPSVHRKRSKASERIGNLSLGERPPPPREQTHGSAPAPTAELGKSRTPERRAPVGGRSPPTRWRQPRFTELSALAVVGQAGVDELATKSPCQAAWCLHTWGMPAGGVFAANHCSYILRRVWMRVNPNNDATVCSLGFLLAEIC